MSIRIKVATTTREIDDVFRLRYQVYSEEGSFQNVAGGVIADKYDAMPSTVNLIAYSGETPVATLRLIQDSDVRMPADHTYDFSHYRAQVIQEAAAQGGPDPLFVSAGMLAVAAPWRNKRVVLYALFKLIISVMRSWRATHIILTVNQNTVGIYRRFNLHSLCDKYWMEEAGEWIVPLCGDLTSAYEWTFGAFTENHQLVQSFSDSFEILLLDKGSRVFSEGEPGDAAYLVSQGTIQVTKNDPETGREITLAHLRPGEMFGELSLIDDEPRSAIVTAVDNTELIVLNREMFWRKVNQDGDNMHGLLALLSSRIRKLDQLVFVHAHGSNIARMRFFLEKLRAIATPSRKKPGHHVVFTTVAEFARMANVSEEDAQSFLADLQAQGSLQLAAKSLTFVEAG